MTSSQEGSQHRDSRRKFSRRVGDQLLSLLLRCLTGALCYTYLPVNHFYGVCVGRFLWWLRGDAKHATEANLAIAFPELPQEERETLAKQSLSELGKTITELGPLWCGSRRRVENLITEVRGDALVNTARDQGKGVIALVLHFGAWEMAGLHLSIHHNVVSLYRPPRLKPIEDFTRKSRERFGAKLVPTTVSGVRSLFRSLKQANMVAILPDQDPGESGSVYAPLFGRDTRTMVLASRLASKTNSEVFFCLAERLPNGKGYRIHFIPADPLVGSRDEHEAATALNAGIESAIKINPAQYQWSYKRFRASVGANPYDRNQPTQLKIHRPDERHAADSKDESAASNDQIRRAA